MRVRGEPTGEHSPAHLVQPGLRLTSFSSGTLCPNYSFKRNNNRTDYCPLNSGVRPMTGVFVAIALASFVALLCMHPFRSRLMAPRIIAFLVFLLSTCMGLSLLSLTYDAYVTGHAPYIGWRHDDLLIAAHPTYALVSIMFHSLASLLLVYFGWYMLRISLLTRKPRQP